MIVLYTSTECADTSISAVCTSIMGSLESHLTKQDDFSTVQYNNYLLKSCACAVHSTSTCVSDQLVSGACSDHLC